MSETWKCKECESTLQANAKSDFNSQVSFHLDRHGCTCDFGTNFQLIKCQRCTWYED